MSCTQTTAKLILTLSGALMIMPPGASAGSSQSDDQAQVTIAPAGQVPAFAAGQVGVRETNLPTQANKGLSSRQGSRIANRVQNRIRNRIDRNYDPKANATSPFKTAEDEVRTATPK